MSWASLYQGKKTVAHGHTYINSPFSCEQSLHKASCLHFTRVSRACWLFQTRFSLATTWLSVRNGNFERYSAFLSARKVLKLSPRLDKVAILGLPHALVLTTKEEVKNSPSAHANPSSIKDTARKVCDQNLQSRNAVQCSAGDSKPFIPFWRYSWL